MNTSILTVMLAGALMAEANATPTWQTSYGQAQQQGAAQQKPIAIVFASGPNSWAKLVQEPIASEATQLLAQRYVCLYVDTSTSDGRKLAQDFEFKDDTGLVISDRTGEVQAFWHEGTLTNHSFIRSLEKYSVSETIVQTTEVSVTTTQTDVPR